MMHPEPEPDESGPTASRPLAGRESRPRGLRGARTNRYRAASSLRRKKDAEGALGRLLLCWGGAVALGLATAGAVVFFADAVIIDIVETALRSLQAEAGPDVVTATVKAALVGAVLLVAALLTFAGASAQAVTHGLRSTAGKRVDLFGKLAVVTGATTAIVGSLAALPANPIVLPYWWLLGVSAALFGAVLVRRLLLLRRNRRGLGHPRSVGQAV